MKPVLALLLLLPLAMAGCGDDKKEAEGLPAIEKVTFKPLDGIPAERLKFTIDKDTGDYVVKMGKRLNTAITVEVADVKLSASDKTEQLVLLRGATPCTPDSCKLAIVKEPDEATNTVTNIMGYVPENQQILLSNIGGDHLRDILITSGTIATRYRYGVVLVDVNFPPSGNYEPIGDEPNPLRDGDPK